MKTIQKIFMLGSVILLCLCLGACSGKDAEVIAEVTTEAEPQTEAVTEEATTELATETTSEEIENIGLEGIYPYELESMAWEEDGINFIYPVVVNLADEEKANYINEAIGADVYNYVVNIMQLVEDPADLTIEAVYTTSDTIGDPLSINYFGSYYFDGAAYPVSFYHTITIDVDSTNVVPLSDLFTIDETFTEIYKMSSIYSQNSIDFDLQGSGVNPADVINEQYTDEQLIEIFSQPEAEYYLDNMGVTLSVEVPHVYGDHLEMFLSYDQLDMSVNPDSSSFWENATIMTDELEKFPGAEYYNETFEFVIQYPDIFGEGVVSDSGDGITMESEDDNYGLMIWGGYNIDESTGTSLLETAKSNYSNVITEYADGDSYRITYSEEVNGTLYEHFECGYVNDEKGAFFHMYYPQDASDSLYKIKMTMYDELCIYAF